MLIVRVGVNDEMFVWGHNVEAGAGRQKLSINTRNVPTWELAHVCKSLVEEHRFSRARYTLYGLLQALVPASFLVGFQECKKH